MLQCAAVHLKSRQDNPLQIGGNIFSSQLTRERFGDVDNTCKVSKVEGENREQEIRQEEGGEVKNTKNPFQDALANTFMEGGGAWGVH